MKKCCYLKLLPLLEYFSMDSSSLGFVISREKETPIRSVLVEVKQIIRAIGFLLELTLIYDLFNNRSHRRFGLKNAKSIQD